MSLLPDTNDHQQRIVNMYPQIQPELDKKASEHEKQAKESFNRRVMTEATDRMEKNFYTGNMRSMNELEAEMEKISRNPYRYLSDHPEIKKSNLNFEKEVIRKMIELS